MTLGVSGRLYQSTVVFYDKETNSLWSQVDGKAIAGKMLGKKMKQIPLIRMKWSRWKKLYPHSLVLSKETGFPRNYSVNPYARYQKTDNLIFPVRRVSKALPKKEFVLGISFGKHAKAYPYKALKTLKAPLKDKIGEGKFTISYDRKGQSPTVEHAGKPYPAFTGSWFAWYVFHPNTKIYKAPKIKKQ